MSVVGFGVIGLGVIGKLHAKVLSIMDGAQLVGVHDINRQTATETAGRFGCKYYDNYQDMLDDKNIQAVAICLPSGMHYDAAVKAVNAGKHLMVEKPLEITTERAEKIIRICRDRGVKLGCILQHRFDDAIVGLKSAVEQDVLGKLYFGASRTIWYRDHDYYFKSNWKGTRGIDGGGALMNQSIHYIDLLQHIMGPVERVSGVCVKMHHALIEAKDTGIASLVFTSGAVGSIEGTTLAYPGFGAELCIYGENGTVYIKNDKLSYYKLKRGRFPLFDEFASDLAASTTGASNPEAIDCLSHRKQYADFVQAIHMNRDPIVTGEDAIRSLALIEAIYHSSEAREWIAPHNKLPDCD